MKKLFLLLALFSVLCVGCSEPNDPIDTPQDPTEQPGNDTGNGDDGNEDENGGNNDENEGNEDENKTFITDAEGNIIVEAEGGEVVVAVTTNMEYDVVIPEGAQAWLSVADTRGELRMEKLTFTVAENVAEERSANVELVDSAGKSLQTIRFTQRAFEKVFESDGEGSYIVEAEGGKVVVAVTTNIDYDVVIPEEAQAWLSVADTRAVRNEKLTFTVAENVAEERSANVELVDSAGKSLQTIKFTQRAFEKVFESDGEGSYIVEAKGGDIQVNVTTNIEYSINIPDDAQAWLSVADTRAVRNEKLTFTVAENKTYEERSAVVALLDGDKKELQIINIIQESAIISCANNEIIYTTKYGYPIYLSVTTGYGCNIVAHTYENGYGKIVFDNDVKTIPSNAFKNCNSITTITLPDSVTSIGDYAFYGCSSLIEFSGKYASEDGRCLIIDGTLHSFAPAGLTNYTIPNSVTSIGSYAFYGCSSLTSITIPDSVTSIGWYAFADCSSLTSVTIPDSVTSIGGYAFYNCSSLTSVTIPDSVTSIGEEAFSGCTGELIVNCNIPSASKYYSGAFYKSKFTKVTIGDGVTSIGSYAFYGCTGELIVNCNIPSGSDYDEGAFYNSKFTKVTIGDSVTSIGDYAFSGCSSLTSVTIPDGVTSIGNYAFSGCSSLTSINIPDGVTSIGEKAFNGCSSLIEFSGKYASEDGRCLIIDGTLHSFAPAGLTNYTIPNSVTSIGSYAFYGCSSLTSITIPDSVTSIGSNAFYGCSSLTSVTIGNSVTSIGSNAFRDCWRLTSVTIPDSVTSIGDYAFMYCEGLTSITIPNSVTSIGDNAFEDCSSLTSITIPNSVTTIGKYAFSWCSSLISITIPDSVTSIGYCAFYRCSSLTSVTIPDSVTSIGESAFMYCSSLTSVYCKATTPPTGGNNMFYNNASGRKIYVPHNSVDAYKSASYWSDYASAIEGYDF